MSSKVVTRLVQNFLLVSLFLVIGCTSTNLKGQIQLDIRHDEGSDYVIVQLENTSNRNAKFFDTLEDGRAIPYYFSFMAHNSSGERVRILGEGDDNWWYPESIEGSLPPIAPWLLSALPPKASRTAKIQLSDIKSKISAAANDENIVSAKMRARVYLDRYGRHSVETESDWLPLE